VRDRLTLVSLGVVSMLFAGIARAAGPDTATVLRNLHEANQMQMAAGQIAKVQGQTVEVQTFGATLVEDHMATEKKVVALAAEENIDLRSSVPAPSDRMRQLTSVKGAAFDELFAAEMLLDSQKILAEAKTARDKTSDDRLKFLLEVTMPVLDAHHQRARALVDTFGPSAIGAEAAKRAAAKHRSAQ